MIYGPSNNVNTNRFKQSEVWRMLQCVEEEREEEPPSGTHLWWCVEDNVAVDDKDRGSSTFTFTNLDTFLLQIRWQCILLSLSCVRQALRSVFGEFERGLIGETLFEFVIRLWFLSWLCFFYYFDCYYVMVIEIVLG